MEKKNDISRWEFLKSSAVAGACTPVLGGLLPARGLGANDRIRVGVLGTGGRAQYLMRLFQTVPSVELAAVCDVYAPHREQALEIAGLDA